MRALLVAMVAVIGCGESPQVPDAAMPDAAIDAPPGVPLYGFVTLERWSRGDTTYTMVAVPVYPTDGTQPAVERVDDHCIAHRAGWAEAGLTAPSFGPMWLLGAREGTVQFGDAGYETPASLRPGWNAGDVMTVRAQGADLPGFELTGTVPPAPQLTSVDMTRPGPGDVVLHRTAPFELTWVPTDGEVFALILQLRYGDLAVLRGIQCFFPGQAGAGAVPAAALARLEESGFVHHTNFYFSRVERKRAVLPGLDLDLLTWNGSSIRVGVE